APSEIRYELCSLWTTDGLLDLPTTTAPRGGIQYTNDWSWAQIMDASLTSFTKLTEAQVIADTPKNCTELPCPEFVDRRLDVAVTCITGSFLQDVGYRENVATLIDGLTLKHEREVNEDVINQILTQAGAAIVIPAQGAGGTGTNADTSAVSSILAAVDVAAIDMRYREQMSENQVLEVILPQWVLAQWRADIGRRNAWHADPFALANATIMQWFSVRNIRPQFIRGWQDAQSGLVGGPGDITAPIVPITALPTTVDFLIYPAGAIVLARQDVVTLTNVYDSTNLRQNLYTALFMEEGYAPIFPCGEVRRYTANACPSGATGHQVHTSCAAPAA
ncbi:MAG TPA: major capsid protein, partial [Streptomyces sp.]|nr:major capsid protein [Streptomyces sp.]